jgi:hypothetical protein
LAVSGSPFWHQRHNQGPEGDFLVVREPHVWRHENAIVQKDNGFVEREARPTGTRAAPFVAESHRWLWIYGRVCNAEVQGRSVRDASSATQLKWTRRQQTGRRGIHFGAGRRAITQVPTRARYWCPLVGNRLGVLLDSQEDYLSGSIYIINKTNVQANQIQTNTGDARTKPQL